MAAFAISDVLLSEAGLFATLTLGVALANQRFVSLSRVAGFGETLEVLIIGTLFPAEALVKIEALVEYAWQIVLLVGALVFLVRPLTAAVSLLKTRLTWRERTLIGWVDPGVSSRPRPRRPSRAPSPPPTSKAYPLSRRVRRHRWHGDRLRPVGQASRPVARPDPTASQRGRLDRGRDLGSRARPSATGTRRVRSAFSSSSPEEVQAEVAASGVPTVSLTDTEARIVDAAQDANVGQVAVLALPAPG